MAACTQTQISQSRSVSNRTNTFLSHFQKAMAPGRAGDRTQIADDETFTVIKLSLNTVSFLFLPYFDQFLIHFFQFCFGRFLNANLLKVYARKCMTGA